MTNHEYFAGLTGIDDPVEIESLKMLLERIYDDVERDIFEDNYDKYLILYKEQINWLNSEREQERLGGDE